MGRTCDSKLTCSVLTAVGEVGTGNFEGRFELELRKAWLCCGRRNALLRARGGCVKAVALSRGNGGGITAGSGAKGVELQA